MNEAKSNEPQITFVELSLIRDLRFNSATGFWKKCLRMRPSLCRRRVLECWRVFGAY